MQRHSVLCFAIACAALLAALGCHQSQRAGDVAPQVRAADSAPLVPADDKLAAWNTRLRGAVYESGYVDGVDADLAALHQYGFTMVRVFFPAKEDEDTRALGLDLPGAMTPEDVDDLESEYFSSARFERSLELLDATVAAAQRNGLAVVLAPSSVPGSHGKGPARWRLYRDDRWHRRLAAFWARIAARYRDEPCVVGYDLLNEPGFEVTAGIDVTDVAALHAWWSSIIGTPADLNAIYREVASAVRAVDPQTPLVLEPSLFGSPFGLENLEPLADSRVVYSVHHYEPWLYTTWRMNRQRWSYPGQAPAVGRADADDPGPLVAWDSARDRHALVDPVEAWSNKNSIPARRIYLGEFGCDRRVDGAARFLGDILNLAESAGWHWTFYAFRERAWSGMDYELGPQPRSRARPDAEMLRPMIEAAAVGKR